MTLAETAHAKLNLALHVRGREPDGYHRLETLFVFCAHGDVLRAEPADTLSLAIEGPFAADLDAAHGDNLVLRAARVLTERCGVTAGAALTLDKRLPVASGIGGGSADAAAALRLLCRLWEVALPAEALHAIAAALGADVPACLSTRPQRGEGRGDRLTALDAPDLSGLAVLLLNPRLPLATEPVFEAWDGQDSGPLGEAASLAAMTAARNDLEPPAIALVPEIASLLDWLRAQPGATLARMSGSGATCFALFADAAARDAAAARAAIERPGDWRLATWLL
ncbi:MAG: 4-(cytidine 5'-diphospho)-2-C-methyl-D-erythritol kinase [Sphingomonadaceae bacterium]|nr:4-(cytidine 5'-diphospho)-2-C-methyl-D-erythritol kinase [Sphingomonadaceae bacterium]